MNFELSASLMCADFSRLHEQLSQLRAGGVTRLHLDFADGQFASNLLLGTEVFAMIGRDSDLTIESHLMLQDPSAFLHLFIPGSDVVILHVESQTDLAAALDTIRRAGKTAGLALRPETPSRAVVPYLRMIGHVLVMCVRPGFAGGEFLPASVETIRELRQAANAENPSLDIQADGAISAQTIPTLLEAGANVFVGGSSGLFVGDDLTGRAQALRQLMNPRPSGPTHKSSLRPGAG
jgi:ribulose-phosphate 3-epimerase